MGSGIRAGRDHLATGRGCSDRDDSTTEDTAHAQDRVAWRESRERCDGVCRVSNGSEGDDIGHLFRRERGTPVRDRRSRRNCRRTGGRIRGRVLEASASASGGSGEHDFAADALRGVHSGGAPRPVERPGRRRGRPLRRSSSAAIHFARDPCAGDRHVDPRGVHARRG